MDGDTHTRWQTLQPSESSPHPHVWRGGYQARSALPAHALLNRNDTTLAEVAAHPPHNATQHTRTHTSCLVHTFCIALRMPPVGWVTVSLLRSIVGRPGHSPRLSDSIATETDTLPRCPSRWRCASSPRTLLVTKASALDGRLAQHAALTPRKATDFSEKGLLHGGGLGASNTAA